MGKVSNKLTPALRLYRHNGGSEELTPAFDFDLTQSIVAIECQRNLTLSRTVWQRDVKVNQLKHRITALESKASKLNLKNQRLERRVTKISAMKKQLERYIAEEAQRHC